MVASFWTNLKKTFMYRDNPQYCWRRYHQLIEKFYNLNTSYNSPLARLRKSWNLVSLTNCASVPISKFKSLAKTFCYIR